LKMDNEVKIIELQKNVKNLSTISNI
jgi:hypothetical protein